jgi:hypothetical protein
VSIYDIPTTAINIQAKSDAFEVYEIARERFYNFERIQARRNLPSGEQPEVFEGEISPIEILQGSKRHDQTMLTTTTSIVFSRRFGLACKFSIAFRNNQLT